MKRFVLAVVLAFPLACDPAKPPAPVPVPDASAPEVTKPLVPAPGEAKEGSATTEGNSVADGFEAFERFERSLRREGASPDSPYIVDGDVPIWGQKELRAFWEKLHARSREGLIVHRNNGADSVWPWEQQKNLTYCVSKTFGGKHAEVVKAMREAAGAWEGAANVRFVYVDAEDERCDAANSRVIFDVRPITAQSYLARAFFPDQPRVQRNVMIDGSSYSVTLPLTLAGILRHELGHTLGLRHEHIRPDARASGCGEDDNWRPITSYDPYSVMHYPQCNGRGDFSLTLTDKDREGIRLLYGAPGQKTALVEALEQAKVKNHFRVEFNSPGVREVTSFRATPNTALEARLVVGPEAPINGATLLVEFGNRGKISGFDCQADAQGLCALSVPADRNEGRLYLQAEAAGVYDVSLEYVPVKPER